jgi:hypothetical protein
MQMSDAAQLAGTRTGIQNLQLFGGDRKQAIETLIASGAKPENPQLGFFKNVMRKVFGGTKTSSKQISATQSIGTKVKVRNFGLKGLRLTTKGNNAGVETRRHVDFKPSKPGGGQAQVKDIGTVIGKGTPFRMFEQEIKRPGGGRQGEIRNSYFDPKTGQKFMQTSEVANSFTTTKLGQVTSKKKKSTDRQIDLLGPDGKATSRYNFDYGTKRVTLQNLNAQGEVTSSYRLSKKTDYFKLVDRLSQNPPSAQQAKPLISTPVVGRGSFGGHRFEGAQLQHH